MRFESSAREFCIFPTSRTFSVVGSLDGSLVKISKKIMWEEMRAGLQCTRVLQPQPQPQNLQFVPHIGQICGMEDSKPQIFCGCGIACTGIHPAKCGCGRNAASRAVSLTFECMLWKVDSRLFVFEFAEYFEQEWGPECCGWHEGFSSNSLSTGGSRQNIQLMLARSLKL